MKTQKLLVIADFHEVSNPSRAHLYVIIRHKNGLLFEMYTVPVLKRSRGRWKIAHSKEAKIKGRYRMDQRLSCEEIQGVNEA